MPHRLGQVFLKDKNILRKIVQAVPLSSDDVLVEIGCGHGDLTVQLAPFCQRLVVFELDGSCIEQTKRRCAQFSHIEFVHQDILTVALTDWITTPCRLVANIPYYISAKILKWMIQYRSLLRSAHLMVQKEFAQKVTALPQSSLYTSLTVYLSYYFAAKKCFDVSRNCFRPIPKVDSSVIALLPNTKSPDLEDSTLFFDFVRSCFSTRRKKIKNGLLKSPYLNLNSGFLSQKEGERYYELRPETLSLDQFLFLFNIVKPFLEPQD